MIVSTSALVAAVGTRRNESYADLRRLVEGFTTAHGENPKLQDLREAHAILGRILDGLAADMESEADPAG